MKGQGHGIMERREALLIGITTGELDWLHGRLYSLRSGVAGLADYGIYGYRRLNDKAGEGIMQARGEECLAEDVKPLIKWVEDRMHDAASMDKRRLNYYSYHALNAAHLWIGRRLVELAGAA